MKLSVVPVVIGIVVVLIGITAAVALVTTYELSANAVRDITQEFSYRTADSMTLSLQGLFRPVVRGIYAAQFRVLMDKNFRSPNDTSPYEYLPTQYPKWEYYRQWASLWGPIVCDAQIHSDFELAFGLVGFADGAYVECVGAKTTPTFSIMILDDSTRNLTSRMAQMVDKYYNLYDVSPNMTDPFALTYDPRLRSWFTNPLPYKYGYMEWTGVYVTITPLLPVISLRGPLVTSNGTFLGMFVESLPLSGLSTTLRTMTPEHGHSFLLDNELRFLGASHTSPMYTTDQPENSTIPSYCAPSDVKNGGKPQMFCRYQKDEYPFSPLNDYTVSGRNTQGRTYVGGEWYHVAERVVTSHDTKGVEIPGMRWTLVLFVPEAYMLQPIQNASNLSIGIVVGLVVFLAVVGVLPVLYSLKGLLNFNAPHDAKKKFAIVFTDIESSTTLWGRFNKDMSEGLTIHNDVIRQVLKKYDGYEVKTIGDSFMIVFNKPMNALKFGAEVQRRLYESTWPSSITAFYHKSVPRAGRWNGIRVRIGMHYGNAIPKYESTTGKYDYYGPAVNVAARVESTAIGGHTFISRDFYDAVVEVGNDNPLRVGPQPSDEIQLTSVGENELKGVDGAVELFDVHIPHLQRSDLCGSDTNSVIGDPLMNRKHSVNTALSRRRVVRHGLMTIEQLQKSSDNIRRVLQTLLLNLQEPQRSEVCAAFCAKWHVEWDPDGVTDEVLADLGLEVAETQAEMEIEIENTPSDTVVVAEPDGGVVGPNHQATSSKVMFSPDVKADDL